ncbi:MAG TPA: 2-C-methyl-D-erythritol 2,4-cyclodiphosphate synthase, partial [Oscillospiraceae bacterium]|nr:2-C-methyl-D-erythritol 2,4-cyclodiphosphate synthase [Oscillospiraceae bacterium]
RRVAALLAQNGYRVENIDATLVAQRPKLAGYLPAMRKNMALALGLDAACVNVKATTEESLGFTGAEQGIAAHAVALLTRL